MSKMWLHPRYGNSGRQRVRSCQFYIRLLHSASYCRIAWNEEEGVGGDVTRLGSWGEMWEGITSLRRE